MGTGFETDTAEPKSEPATVSAPEQKEVEKIDSSILDLKRRLTN